MTLDETRQLFTSGPDGRDAKAFAAHVVSVCQLFSVHVARLVGELGMQTLLARSLALASTTFPGLKIATPTAAEHPLEVFRRCLEAESPSVAEEMAVHVFRTFTGLLERFIGVGLVANLLGEVWPAIFESDTKETK